jgi:2-dehydropantoate 2-reductase
MRILVVGAGAVGGYFGGRLLEQRRDVTFLVRPGRAAQLAASGLIIRSRLGDVNIPAPRAVLAENLHETFDLILLSSKAYDLDSAIASFAPADGPQTAILPLLNGMRHLDVLDQKFGADRILGGQCLIAASLNEQHEIVHLNENHDLTFGERDGEISDRVRAISHEFSGARFNSRASSDILLEMWEKWAFLATLAGSTCLMRATIGDIVAALGGREFTLALFDECRSVAQVEGHTVGEASIKRAHTMLTTPGSSLTASMLRDIERNAPIEAEHILGDMLRRGTEHGLKLPHLALAFTHLKAYESRRERKLAMQKSA